MYADHSVTQIAGQAIIAIYFIWQGVKNVLLWNTNVARLRAKGFAEAGLIDPLVE